jgi:hypothetical protein
VELRYWSVARFGKASMGLLLELRWALAEALALHQPTSRPSATAFKASAWLSASLSPPRLAAGAA